MGIIDSLKNLGRGAGRSTVALPLQGGEQELMRVHATARPGGLRSVGGQLVLTTHRVAFLPWNTVDISGVLAWALPKAGAPRAVVRPAINGVQAAIDGTRVDGVAASVGIGGPASLLSGPTLVVTSADGTRNVFGVVAGIGSPNLSARNVDVRDQFVAAARQAAGA